MVLCTEGEGARLPLLVLSEKPLSLLCRQLSSLCRLRDISLRPEGVFPSRGAFGKKILFFVDCQGLSYKERWHCVSNDGEVGRDESECKKVKA